LGDKISQILPTSTDDVTVVFMLDANNLRHLVGHLRRNSKDCLLSGSDSFFSAFESNRGIFAEIIVTRLVDVDLGTCVIFDGVDRCATLPENSGNSARGYGKLGSMTALLLELDCLVTRCELSERPTP